MRGFRFWNLATRASAFLFILFVFLYPIPNTLHPSYAAKLAYDWWKTPVPKVPGPGPAGLDVLERMVGNVISVIVGLGFIAMLVLLVWAGIKYLTSGGEPKAIQSAHYTVTWALLGVAFLAIAWLILQLISSFTGIDVTIFNIKALCNVGGNDICR